MAIASAACVAQGEFANFPAKGLMDIQAVVVPGKGVAAAQAATDVTRANQGRIFAEIAKGTDPAAILELLKGDPAIDSRQFGIVDVQGRALAFSGAKGVALAASRQGRVDGTGIVYSIQGNLLASEEVVTAAASAMGSAPGTLSDRVMAAMEAADGKGGDKRCSCATSPRPNAPCTTRTAQVAYIASGRSHRR